MDYLPGGCVSILAVVYSCSYLTPFAMHYPSMAFFHIVQLSSVPSPVSNILRSTSRLFHHRHRSSLPSRSHHHPSLRHQFLAPELHSSGHSNHTFPVPHSHIFVLLLPKKPSQRCAHSSQKSPRTSSPHSFCTTLLLRQRSRPFCSRLLTLASRHLAFPK